jgi:3-phenylpropionate/trans-cinnamate dioxygenase ferredoxin subunit
MARVKIATLTDLSEETMTKVEVDGKMIVIGLVNGEPFAMEGSCSHMGYDLSKGVKEGPVVRCKMHGAEFDMRTGDVLRNMQAKKLKTYPLTVEGEEVFIEL